MGNSKKLLNYKKTEILKSLRYINQILISLHQIGSCYDENDIMTYNKLTTEFIDNWRVTHKLADIRSILSDQFSDEIGDDDMDELEREMDNVKYWSIDDQNP